MTCQFRNCANEATHVWGPEDESVEGHRVYMCCDHFSKFVASMFTTHDLRTVHKHAEFVRLYEERTKRTSRLIDTFCHPEEPEQ